MKRYFFAFKTSLLLGLSGCALSLFAAAPEPLFYVSLVNTDALNHTLIVRPKTKRSYPNLGVRVNHPDFSFANASNNGNDSILCKLNPANKFCLFSSAPRVANQFTLSRRANGVRTKEKIDIQLALNAKGSAPLSVQNYRTEAVTPGRIIGYLYGWVSPPPAAEVEAAHYTHVLIAFGLFSMSAPGTINVDALSGFSTPDLATYVAELQAQGVKVLLSLGGASTSIPDTTVSFDQAVSLAATPSDFITDFINSMNGLVSTYGFDGFDFDIEAGLNEANSFSDPTEGCLDDTIYNPKCDIAYLSEIINGFHKDSSASLLTLAPQLANVAATPSFTAIWGNYASLAMATASSLEWVGFQTYNSGCVFGIDRNCYPLEGTTLTSSPDSAVAVATDLLEDWPEKTSTGVVTGFQPYKSGLNPSQVVLGYVSQNAEGASDGSPPAVINVVKDAIQCLRTGEACDSYTPPNTYPDIGGVFDWTLNYDASNSYAFSTGLYPCVVEGDCSNISEVRK